MDPQAAFCVHSAFEGVNIFGRKEVSSRSSKCLTPSHSRYLLGSALDINKPQKKLPGHEQELRTLNYPGI